MEEAKAPRRKVMAVEFEATIQAVRSLASGSIQVTLELQDYCTPQAQWLLGERLNYVRVLVEKDNDD